MEPHRNPPTALVLDFDGVICDSVEECFVSSWTAYHILFRKEPAAEAPPAARHAFSRLRPFIRTGEDFVVIQDIIARGDAVSDQKGFDAAARRASADTRRLFRDLFYQARTTLLERDRQAWLGLNRIYPHMAAAFARMPRGAPVWILSTKKPRFVAEVLAANGISVREGHILASEDEPKLSAVEGLREREGFPGAILVEDQIDAIKGNTNPRIRVFLATWGYVKEEWLEEPAAVPLLKPEGFLELVEAEFAR
ncbi:MAG: HAD family hydrolase [Spirochaetia bacterium]